MVCRFESQESRQMLPGGVKATVRIHAGGCLDASAEKRSRPTGRRAAAWLCAFSVILWTGVSASAQQKRPGKPREKQPADKGQVTPDQLKQIQELQKDADLIGSWDQQSLLMNEATDNIFAQQGWDSEADQYARQLMRNVGGIPPWKPQERQQVFMENLQVRYGLTPAQRDEMNATVQHEAMMVGARHFKDLFPVVMEVVQTRVKNKPFTAEQVQRWSQAIGPVMDDSLKAVERVTGKLRDSMTPEQQKTLDQDTEALKRRHGDVEKMVERWKQGGWNPTDWGLQNDPVHAGAMVDYRRQQAERDRLVAEAEAMKALEEGINVTDESAWDAYVRRFCNKYACTDPQRATAKAILKKSKQNAIGYRAARRDQLDKCEQLLSNAESKDEQQHHTKELEKLLAPIRAEFDLMKARLYAEILTTEQHNKFGPPEKTAANEPAKE
ncbi:MAG: hypothetical protein ABII12_10110 [Planctomycetota bacterium]